MRVKLQKHLPMQGRSKVFVGDIQATRIPQQNQIGHLDESFCTCDVKTRVLYKLVNVNETREKEIALTILVLQVCPCVSLQQLPGSIIILVHDCQH